MDERAKAHEFRDLGRELVRSGLVVKLAAELDDPALLLRAAVRTGEIAALIVAGNAGPVPPEGPGFGELVCRAYPGRSLPDDDAAAVDDVGAAA